ncbi:hypothetical protein BDF14DRAFT_1828060 [Spinellus fusiger]|nr:hypothetical protein BDF14DRAFT_1828060 [Spinellus fusiger]
MSSIYISLDDQKKQDTTLTLQSMGIQLGVNLAIAFAVILAFSWMRPRHTLVYAPKTKFSTPDQRPPLLGSGWFDWILPILNTSDTLLMDRMGPDAVLFLMFLRLLRRILAFMTVAGLCVLLPINIVATKYTGVWPPAPGLDFLSISGINYLNGKLTANPDTGWYWSPTAATWLFSLVIQWGMYRASCDLIEMRQKYLHRTKIPSDKTLFIGEIPKAMRTDSQLKQWLETFHLPHPMQQTLIGHHNATLTELRKRHDQAVCQLENTLASYLSDGKQIVKKRPTVSMGITCFGRKVDAIYHFTKRVHDLEQDIKRAHQSDTKNASYGWVSFKKIEWAHETYHTLTKILNSNVSLASPPNDLIWQNLPMDNSKRKIKRWIGRLLYVVFVFAWMIPVGALSAASNIVNVTRLFPNAEVFIADHKILVGVIQAWFTPIMTAVFFFVLPMLFRYLSQLQGYRTKTTLNRKVLTKLYFFFIINNLLVFTLTSILIGIYGQLKVLIVSGALAENEGITEYMIQLAKNIADVSTFWINYVCIKGLGITIELIQLMPLLTITLNKFLTRPSPRRLRELAQPAEFDYAQNYNILLFFFTIALIYSAIAPLVLPFALIYFTIATVVYKYMLTYIYITKIESGGKMWPVLFQIVMTSVILFQVIMIIVLNLKGGHIQSFVLIPLPFLTLIYQYFYGRRIHHLLSFVRGTDGPSGADETILLDIPANIKSQLEDLSQQYQDPALSSKLHVPMVHKDVEHLLPSVFPPMAHSHVSEEILKHNIPMKDLSNKSKNISKGDPSHTDHQRTQLTTIGGNSMTFETLGEDSVNGELFSDELQPIDENTEDIPVTMLPIRLMTQYNDVDDERSELVKVNYADNYWHQQTEHLSQTNDSHHTYEKQPMASSRKSSIYPGGEKHLVEEISESVENTSSPELNVTFELADIYASWSPTSLRTRRETLMSDHFDNRSTSLYKVESTSHLHVMARRMSVPEVYRPQSLEDYRQSILNKRRCSLPTNFIFKSTHSTETVAENIDHNFPKRQNTLPLQRIYSNDSSGVLATEATETTSRGILQRNQTLPYHSSTQPYRRMSQFQSFENENQGISLQNNEAHSLRAVNLLNLAHPQGLSSSTLSLELIRRQYMESVPGENS